MNSFVFYNPTKIYFGNQYEHLADEIKTYGNKVLLVYGGGSIKRNGLYDNVINILHDNNIEVVELSGIEPNPRHTTVNRGAKMCRENGVEVILAVGGGSTIDSAKAIAAATYYDGDCWDLVTRKAAVTKALPIVDILTLSATASEMNCGGVISNLDTNEKIGLQHPLLFPKASFLNPENTYTVSAYQTASGSADIMSHIFDMYYFTLKNKLQMTNMVALDVIKTVVKYAPIAIKNPTDYEARANLMWAATWGLNGFLGCGASVSATCHALEHELSAFYDITHGHGLAILTPKWLSYVLSDKTAPIIKELGVNVFNVDDNLDDIDAAKKTIEALESFFTNDLGLSATLSSLNIDDKNFKLMAKKVVSLRSNDGILHGFVDLDEDDIVNIFKMCL